MSIFNGYTTGSKLNYDGISPAVTTTVNYSTINGYAKESVPILFPYGFVSIPTNNANCSYIGLGGFYAAAVNGYTNTLPKTSNLSSLERGESALYSSGNYTFMVKKDKLYVVFTNGGDDIVSTRVTIDENVNTVLIDTIAEIAAVETKMNAMITVINQLVNTIPTLQAGSGGTLSPSGTTPIPAYTPTANFTRDQSFLGSDGLHNFVDENGELIT